MQQTWMSKGKNVKLIKKVAYLKQTAINIDVYTHAHKNLLVWYKHY